MLIYFLPNFGIEQMQFFLFSWDVSNKSWRRCTSSKLFQLINFANWNDLSILFVQHLPPLFQQQNWQTRWIFHFIYLKSFLILSTMEVCLNYMRVFVLWINLLPSIYLSINHQSKYLETSKPVLPPIHN